MRRIIAAGLAAAGLLLAGCTSSPGTGQASGTSPTGTGSHRQGVVGPPGTQASGILRLGLAETAADAPALVGWQLGFFGRNLGKATLEPAPFTTTAAEVTALEDGQLDAAYLDPIAALRAWQASPATIKIIAGAASGGAELIVAKHITSPAQLKGRALAAPAGGAQQAAADTWLARHHLPALTTAEATASGAAGLLQQFRTGKIAGAWEPPPLDIQLTDAGGRVLVNENTLWPRGQFPTTVLVITHRYLDANPLAVTALLKGQLQAEHLLTASPATAAGVIGQRLTALGNPLPPAVLAKSLAQLTFTSDPLAGPLLTEARDATAAGLLKPFANLTAIYDLGPLNQALKAAGQQPVSA